MLKAAASGVQYQTAYRRRAQKKGLTEEHQRQQSMLKKVNEVKMVVGSSVWWIP